MPNRSGRLLSRLLLHLDLPLQGLNLVLALLVDTLRLCPLVLQVLDAGLQLVHLRGLVMESGEERERGLFGANRPPIATKLDGKRKFKKCRYNPLRRQLTHSFKFEILIRKRKLFFVL